jgi:hypothetical protein
MTSAAARSAGRELRTRNAHSNKSRRLFILGAGASYAAGLPDASRLAGPLVAYVRGPFEVVYNRPPAGYFDPMFSALIQVLAEESGDEPRSKWPLDFVFRRFNELLKADLEGFRATWVALFEATAQLIYIRSWTAEGTPAYRKFVHALRPEDVLLTFNWDVCPEIAMYSLGQPFSQSLASDEPPVGPWLLKLHGSVDYLIVPVFGDGTPDFLETLDVHPPPPFPGPPRQLVRLKTYDLGYEVRLAGPYAGPSSADDLPGREGIVGGFDVGPYLLTHTLDEVPLPYLLVPGTTKLLYDWQYSIIIKKLLAIRDELAGVYVIGYSFPKYDEDVFSVLRQVAAGGNATPVHIVNPAVGDIPPELLTSIFGRHETHACGFEEFDWEQA